MVLLTGCNLIRKLQTKRAAITFSFINHMVRYSGLSQRDKVDVWKACYSEKRCFQLLFVINSAIFRQNSRCRSTYSPTELTNAKKKRQKVSFHRDCCTERICLAWKHPWKTRGAIMQIVFFSFFERLIFSADEQLCEQTFLT